MRNLIGCFIRERKQKNAYFSLRIETPYCIVLVAVSVVIIIKFHFKTHAIISKQPRVKNHHDDPLGMHKLQSQSKRKVKTALFFSWRQRQLLLWLTKISFQSKIFKFTLMITLHRFTPLQFPSTHTTLFRHPYDVVLTLWTLYRRWNDVVCLRGLYSARSINLARKLKT